MPQAEVAQTGDFCKSCNARKKLAALHIMDIGNTGNMLWIFVTILPQDNELTHDEPKTAKHKGAVLNGDYRFGCTQWMMMKPSCSLIVCTQQGNATRNMLFMYVVLKPTQLAPSRPKISANITQCICKF